VNDLFWFLLVFPMAWPLVAKAFWGTTLNWQETALAFAISTGLVAGVWHWGRAAQVADVEILNGAVTGKSSEHVSCEHSYSCNCVTNKDGSQSCSTCYEHDYDVDWSIQTTAGDIDVDRVDSQGTTVPPGWAAAENDQPAAIEHDYVNWVKGVKESLFRPNRAAAQYDGRLPAYPDKVRDVRFVDRILTDGVNIPDVGAWNYDLALRLRTLGPDKQANVVVVFTSVASPDYADELRTKWLGGRKNDIVVVVGAPDFPKVAWARSFSWSSNDLVNVEMRDRLQAMGPLDRKGFLDAVESVVRADFVRRPMAEFEYLAAEVEPEPWAVILAVIIAFPGSLLLTWWFNRHEVDFFAGRSWRR
jgi:hypothetical protein